MGSRNKNHRSGEKFSGSHTSIIEESGIIVDLLEKIPEVTIISLGLITPGLKQAKISPRLKIREFSGGIALVIRGKSSQQEIRVYTKSVKDVKDELSRSALKLNYHVSLQDIFKEI
ncbi:MAG: DUF2103 domain-containing protein [bacterium]|nr:DUF2103 domain-containing protein [bacterium]